MFSFKLLNMGGESCIVLRLRSGRSVAKSTRWLKCNNFFSCKSCFNLVVWNCWKRNQFKLSMKFHLKREIFYFETLFSHSFNELYFSPIVHMNHMKPIFHDLPFYCTKKVHKNKIICFTFVIGDPPTHFLVFDQTLIYGNAETN